MSTVFGIFYRHQKKVDAKTLQTMSDQLHCWKPDDKGIWMQKYIGLGHLMLHSTPESRTEKLPYYDSSAGLAITADARIDNREELGRHLRLGPSSAREISDSQLILRSYQKWGVDCVKYLIGDFAFAIWDDIKRELYCARDHLGVRPLFYSAMPGFFAFATQIRGLLCLPNFSDKWNEAFIHEMLYIGFPFDKVKTFYKDIQRLEPAHYMIISGTRQYIRRYWKLGESKPQRLNSEQEYIEQARHLIKKAVDSRMRTVFPVGTQLSGGLDSSGITMLAAEHAKRNDLPFSAYSNILPNELLGKEFPYDDERKYINLVCKAANITDVNFACYKSKSMSFFIEDQAKILDGLACQEFSSFTQAHVELAAPKGVRTLFSGYPGDELVTHTPGYAYYNELFREAKWSLLWKDVLLNVNNQKTRAMIQIIRIFLNIYAKNLLKHYQNLKRSPYNVYNINKDCFLNPQTLSLIIKRLSNKCPIPQRYYHSVRESEQYWIGQNPFIPFRMEAENVTSCQYNINMVYPFADIRLLEFFHHAPTNLKRQHGIGRWLYRCAMDDILPEEISKRSKGGYFIVPTYFSIVKKEHLKIRQQIEFLLNQNQLTDLINYKKLLHHWDSFCRGELIFDMSGTHTLVFLNLFSQKLRT